MSVFPCCLPDGSCTEMEFDACVAAGGVPSGFPGATCSQLPPNWCGMGCCYVDQPDGSIVCQNTTYAACSGGNPQLGVFEHDCECIEVDPRNITVKMFMHRTRAWPYHMTFSTAWGGERQTLGLCAAWWLQPPNACPGYLAGSLPQQQMGRVLAIPRTKACFSAQGQYLPGATTPAACSAMGGIWKFNGILYLKPAINLIWTELPACTKRIKLFIKEGEWRPGDPQRDGQGLIIGPPRWHGWATWRDPGQTGEPNPNDGQNYVFGTAALHYPGAAEYRWMLLLPLPPQGASGCTTEPWCYPGVDDDFLFNDCFTYEIPCYDRDTQQEGSGAPWRNVGLVSEGQSAPNPPTIPAGVRGIAAFSFGDAQVGHIPAYCSLGCPQTFPDCQSDFCHDAWENIWRRYKGITAPNKIVWQADPQQRGWFVVYQAEVYGWFAQDGWWLRFDTGFSRPTHRWAAWYEGEVKATWSGDITDQGFRDFIAAQDSAFGVKFEPRYPACNDVLAEFANLNKALGDTIWPAQPGQGQCHDDGGNPPPCLRKFGAPSRWYRGGIQPEQGLFHEIKRTKYTNPEKTQSIVEYGWARLYFSTLIPLLVNA